MMTYLHKARKWWQIPLLLLLSLTPFTVHALGLDCSVNPTAVDFGTYDPLNANPTVATGNIQVSCTVLLVSVGAQVITTLSTGNSNSYATRTMTKGSDSLEYNLYVDASYSDTAIWGNGDNGTQFMQENNLLILLTGTTVNYPVYGSITPGQSVPGGVYNDTIVVTVEFVEVT